MGLRITTWNVAWFGQLLKGHTRTLPRNSKAVRGATEKALQALQRAKIAEQIIRLDPDVLCLQEGPSTGNVNRLESFCNQDLEGRWSVIKRPAGEPWHIRGSQGIFFLVRSTKLSIWQPKLLAQSAWFEATEIESRVDINHVGSGEHNKKWPVIHPLFKPAGQPALEEPLVGDESEGDGVVDLGEREHSHYRHPQVLVLTIGDKRVDIVGCHLKSKFGGDDYRAAGIARRKEVITRSDKALIKKVEQTAVESRIKLSTEASNVRYYIENRFRNEPDPAGLRVGAKAGRVEHAIHNAINTVFDTESDFTSDHRPVSVDVMLATDMA